MHATRELDGLPLFPGFQGGKLSSCGQLTRVAMGDVSARGLADRIVECLATRKSDEALRAAIASLVDRIDEDAAAPDIATTLDVALRLCQQLHGHAKSLLAIPLGRAVHHASRLSAPMLTRAAATTCGLLVMDTGDVVGAIQWFIEALRIAAIEEDRRRMSGLWNNMGMAACGAGSPALAVRCYQRALSLVEKDEEPVVQRLMAYTNLSASYYKLGRVDEGIASGERALLEITPAFVEANPLGRMLVRRNLVRLYVAAGRLEDARLHVEAASCEMVGGNLRMRIAAETARATYEVAAGQVDIALTRLDKAIADARLAPAALHDALVCAVRCEEASGNPARALLRLRELSNHVYNANVGQAREIIRQAGLQDVHGDSSHVEEQDRARLVSQLSPPRQPEGWKALKRLGVAASMPVDGGGWHGIRVGALTRLLAEAHGVPALEARELGFAAEIHDIGMTAIPAELLSKREALDDSERGVVERHAQAGADMLVDGNHSRMLLAREMAHYHHARYDGNGYPMRVRGGYIPLGARMCAITDAYDMMVCGYGSTAPRTMGEALDELRQHAGGQFDPGLVDSFEQVIRSEAGGHGMDLSTHGVEDFQDLVLALKEDRGFA